MRIVSFIVMVCVLGGNVHGATISPIETSSATLIMNDNQNVDWALVIRAPGESLSDRTQLGIQEYQYSGYAYEGDQQSPSPTGNLTVHFLQSSYTIDVSCNSPYTSAEINVYVPPVNENQFVFEIVNGSGNYPSFVRGIWTDDVLVDGETTFNSGYQLLNGVSNTNSISFHYEMPSSVSENSYLIVSAITVPEPTTFSLLGLGLIVLLRKQWR